MYQASSKGAVESGMFPLIRYNPLKKQGERFKVESTKMTKIVALNEARIIDPTSL